MQYILVLHDYVEDTIDILDSHKNLIYMVTQMKKYANEFNYKFIDKEELSAQYEGNYLVGEERKITHYKIESFGYMMKSYTIEKQKAYRIIQNEKKTVAIQGIPVFLQGIKTFDPNNLKKGKIMKKDFKKGTNTIINELINNQLFISRRKSIAPDNE
jgi:hypothetical protein